MFTDEVKELLFVLCHKKYLEYKKYKNSSVELELLLKREKEQIVRNALNGWSLIGVFENMKKIKNMYLTIYQKKVDGFLKFMQKLTITYITFTIF